MAWRARIGQHVRELRIHYCQSSPTSEGLRSFVKSNYAALKKENPSLPILIRECAGAEPRLIARYDFGKEKAVALPDVSAQEVEAHLKALYDFGEKQPKAAGKFVVQ